MVGMVKVVAVLQVGDPQEYYAFGEYTWRWWCHRNGVYYLKITEPHSGAHHNFAKWRVFELLKQKGIVDAQVAIVDADTMIRWDCPDFFSIVGDKLGAVLDLGDVHWILKSLDACKPFFLSNVNWWGYVNAGVIVVNSAHCQLAELMLRYGRCHPAGSYGASIDQTPLNYLIMDLSIEVHLLPLPFNLTKIKGRGLYAESNYVRAGYIWHFNGERTARRKAGAMGATWRIIQNHYA